jgi:hypothetical protein
MSQIPKLAHGGLVDVLQPPILRNLSKIENDILSIKMLILMNVFSLMIGRELVYLT